jgi:hypothetical protein
MTIDLVLAGERYPVDENLLAENASLFTQRPDLFAPSYHIRASVHPNTVRLFVNALEGRTIEVTNENFSGLSRLCGEFEVPELSAKLARFRESPVFRDHSAEDAILRLAIIEERLAQQSQLIERLGRAGPAEEPPPPEEADVFHYEDLGDPDDGLLADLARLSARAKPASGRIECPYTPEYPLVGVVALMNARCGGNVQDGGTVEITASSFFSDKPRDAVKNLADLVDDTVVRLRRYARAVGFI